MLQATKTLQPALATFYNGLSDEQKARFNTLVERRQHRVLRRAIGRRRHGGQPASVLQAFPDWRRGRGRRQPNFRRFSVVTVWRTHNKQRLCRGPTCLASLQKQYPTGQMKFGFGAYSWLALSRAESCGELRPGQPAGRSRSRKRGGTQAVTA